MIKAKKEIHLEYDTNMNFLVSLTLSIILISNYNLFIFIVSLPIIWYLADLISSIFHVYLDLRGAEHWYKDNARRSTFFLHHEYPTLVTNFPDQLIIYKIFSQNIGFFCLFFIVFYLNGCQMDVWLQLVSSSFITASFSEITHKYSHVSNPPFWIKKLQEKNIFLSHGSHHPHHIHFDRNYALLNGWSNPLFNFLVKHLILDTDILVPNLINYDKRGLYITHHGEVEN